MSIEQEVDLCRNIPECCATCVQADRLQEIPMKEEERQGAEGKSKAIGSKRDPFHAQYLMIMT
jgi:hypothetical protein